MKHVKLMTAAVAGISAIGLLVGCGTVRAGYETAPYAVVKKDGSVEIRKYESIAMVGTASGNTRGKAENGAFMKLFRYISGSNEDEKKIAMTTPVFATKAKSGDRMEMFFVLPKDEESTAPEPKDQGVRVVKNDAMTVVAIRFSGRMNPDAYEKQKAQLEKWMQGNNYTAIGDPWTAQYDPPWTPGPLRRNEVLMPIAPSVDE